MQLMCCNVCATGVLITKCSYTHLNDHKLGPNLYWPMRNLMRRLLIKKTGFHHMYSGRNTTHISVLVYYYLWYRTNPLPSLLYIFLFFFSSVSSAWRWYMALVIWLLFDTLMIHFVISYFIHTCNKYNVYLLMCRKMTVKAAHSLLCWRCNRSRLFTYFANCSPVCCNLSFQFDNCSCSLSKSV